MLGSWRAFLTQVQGGRRDKLRPGDILGALTSSGSGSGLSGADVGTIEVAHESTLNNFATIVQTVNWVEIGSYEEPSERGSVACNPFVIKAAFLA